MTTNVTDSAIILDAIAGKDKMDKHTLEQPDQNGSYASCLKKDGLKGRKLAYPKNYMKGWGTDWEVPAVSTTIKRYGLLADASACRKRDSTCLRSGAVQHSRKR